jgi:hypothetical protein
MIGSSRSVRFNELQHCTYYDREHPEYHLKQVPSGNNTRRNTSGENVVLGKNPSRLQSRKNVCDSIFGCLQSFAMSLDVSEGPSYDDGNITRAYQPTPIQRITRSINEFFQELLIPDRSTGSTGSTNNKKRNGGLNKHDIEMREILQKHPSVKKFITNQECPITKEGVKHLLQFYLLLQKSIDEEENRVIQKLRKTISRSRSRPHSV